MSTSNNVQYLVSWVIDVWADNPLDAAQKAREIQLDPDNIADVFKVQDQETGEVICIGATCGEIYTLE